MADSYTNKDSKNAKILELLHKSSLSADTDIICVSVAKNINTFKALNEFISSMNDQNDAITSSIGRTTVTILLPEKLLDKAKSLFSNDIQDINMKVGAIFLKCPKEVYSTVGVTEYITSIFAQKNVIIYEIIVTYTDYVIVIDEKQVYKMASYMQSIFGD